ncbi:MAG: DUF1289 domain-containing protein [Steroidobacteraceae bacterium]
MPDTAPASPWVNACVPDAHGYCVGCYRTINEIAAWGRMRASGQRAAERALQSQ